MRKLLAIGVFVLASSAAQAQYTFEYGGRTIRVDPDRGTVSIPGVYDNSGRKSKRSQDRDSDRPRKPPPQEAKGDPQTPDAATPAPAAATPAPAPAPATVSAPPAPPASPPPPATATAEPPSDTITSTQPVAAAPAMQDSQDVAPAARPAPPPLPPVASAAPAAAPPPAPAPAAVSNPNSPLGLWVTEEKEGKVRIEQCGANLCGYSVDKRTNQNGEQVLLNMKPGKDKWTGRIFDPKSGSTYDSTIALKTQDSLRVQGCALGGMFCGGQTWSRIN